jgi:hypothetical protein
MPAPAPASCCRCWCRTSERHFAADLGRVGSLMVWVDAANGTWSAFVLSTQRTGFITPAASQAAALRMARTQLEAGLRRIEELAPAADASDVLNPDSGPSSMLRTGRKCNATSAA